MPVLTPVPSGDALDIGADRPQTGDVPAAYYAEDLTTVLRGDSARLLEAGAGLSANLIVTSPPYSLGVDYGRAGYVDDQPYSSYLD